MKATNDIGDSEFSEESESLTTLQAGQCHSEPLAPDPGGMKFLLQEGPLTGRDCSLGLLGLTTSRPGIWDKRVFNQGSGS